VLRQPALLPGGGTAQSEREALLAQQGVAAVAGTETEEKKNNNPIVLALALDYGEIPHPAIRCSVKEQEICEP
jgi:hypothetical protein